MLGFSSYLEEQQNTHLNHLEDEIFHDGTDGFRKIIGFIGGVRDMLSGHTKSPMKISTKFDGAPAVFAGQDPSDGKFFVAKKSVFNKDPKVYKSEADVVADTSGELQKKMILAFRYLKDVGIKGMVQGDFMFDKSELKSWKDSNGIDHWIFHPNTLVYAIPKRSKLGRDISNAKIGVVWHTKYSGKDFPSMKATFNQPIVRNHKFSKHVWQIDAVQHDVSGTASMTVAETQQINALLSKMGHLMNRIPGDIMADISNNKEIQIRVKTHINKYIRRGHGPASSKQAVRDLIRFVHEFYQKEASKRSTAKGQGVQKDKLRGLLKFFDARRQRDWEVIFDLYYTIIEAKGILIKKLDQINSISTLLQTADGLTPTGHEGFVVSDHIKGGVKLVDRSTFSAANFNNPKFN